MKNKRILLLLCLLPFLGNAQDLNINVSVISPKIQRTDKQIFTSLQNSVVQFLNGRKWSKDKIMPIERIQGTLIIEITQEISLNRFMATFQFQTIRPVFGSNYTTQLLNIKDETVEFEYQEMQAMDFQENTNVYNLTGVLGFYAYMAMGVDYDSYGKFAGTDYYNQAKAILDASQSINGWRPNDGLNNRNRFYFLDNLTNDRFRPLRETYYMYHRNGLDIMHKDLDKGRIAIEESLKNIQELCRLLPNAMIIRTFFLAKNKELIQIYKEAPVAEKNRMIELLKKLDPANSNDYDTIRN